MASRFDLRVIGTAALLALAAGHVLAQTHKVAAPEKVTRAIGVYEWTGDLAKPNAARLIPVSLFIDTRIEDAGVYLARPVPFVLGTGDEYSIERAGQSEGTLDISYARDIVTRHSASDESPSGAWYGYGTFHTPAEEAKLATPKPSGKAGVIVGGLDTPEDETPHFVYRAPSATGAAGAPGATASAGTTASTAPTPAPGNDPDADPDRPTLRHRDPADQGKPKRGKEGGYVTPPNSSLNDDPNRPTMRRGVPEGQAQAAQLSGLPLDLHQAVAVSDAANRDAHPFTRPWESSREKADTLANLGGLAQPRIANYLLLNKLTPPVVATPAKASTPTHLATVRKSKPASAPAPAIELTREQIDGYTLSYGGLPTFVYTAETPVAIGGPVYITLVVQKLPAGELQVALSSVTDAAHLDRTPWLRPVDVVDPDWSHRASLLFELRAQTSRQFALYRLISAKAEQTFITGIIE